MLVELSCQREILGSTMHSHKTGQTRWLFWVLNCHSAKLTLWQGPHILFFWYATAKTYTSSQRATSLFPKVWIGGLTLFETGWVPLPFFCFVLAEASFRLWGFPSASLSAFISLLPEKIWVLMSLLFRFVICSADLYTISLRLLKWFLLSPAEVMSPLMATLPALFPQDEENSKPNVKVGWWWTGCCLLLWFLQGVREALPTARTCVCAAPGVRDGVAQHKGPRHSLSCLS